MSITAPLTEARSDKDTPNGFGGFGTERNLMDRVGVGGSR